MHVFVYYDVPHEHAVAARGRVDALQAELGCDPRLMRRSEPAGHATTWMEVYAHVPPGFEARLAAAVERSGLEAFTGPRHVERFVAIDDDETR